MEQIVSITSQGQITIPKAVRNAFGIHGTTKAIVRTEGDTIVVRPAADFWSLSGSLKSGKKLSLAQLKKARKSFAKDWPKNYK